MYFHTLQCELIWMEEVDALRMRCSRARGAAAAGGRSAHHDPPTSACECALRQGEQLPSQVHQPDHLLFTNSNLTKKVQQFDQAGNLV